MTTNTELAQAEPRQDDDFLDYATDRPALQTRAAPARTGKVTDLGDLTTAIERQNDILERRAAKPAARPAANQVVERARAASARATQTLAEMKARNTEAARALDDRAAPARARGREDVLDVEQRARMDRDFADTSRREATEFSASERQRLLDENREMRQRLARPAMPVATRAASAVSQRQQIEKLSRDAALHYIRTGEKVYKGHSLADIQKRAMSEGSQADGGILLLPETDMGPIEKLLVQAVPMRQHCTVKTINRYTYKKPLRVGTGGARWGTELASGGQTNTPQYALLDFPAHNLYAEPAVSSDMLEDSDWAIEDELAQGAIDDFSLTESDVVVTGNGVEKPFGFLGYPSANYVSSGWSHGKILYQPSGAAGAFASASADPIIKMGFGLKQGYRGMAKWMMNRLTMGVVRTLKDGTGRYVWSDGDVYKGVPTTLDGREVIEAEQMPDIAANSFSIALADWKRAYIMVDRLGMVVLRDELTAYPQVVFKTRKRVGGGIQNFEAIQVMKFAVS